MFNGIHRSLFALPITRHLETSIPKLEAVKIPVFTVKVIAQLRNGKIYLIDENEFRGRFNFAGLVTEGSKLKPNITRDLVALLQEHDVPEGTTFIFPSSDSDEISEMFRKGCRLAIKMDLGLEGFHSVGIRTIIIPINSSETLRTSLVERISDECLKNDYFLKNPWFVQTPEYRVDLIEEHSKQTKTIACLDSGITYDETTNIPFSSSNNADSLDFPKGSIVFVRKADKATSEKDVYAYYALLPNGQGFKVADNNEVTPLTETDLATIQSIADQIR
ncbi:MAG: hypothetical protein WC890_01800 [Candidatus Margulisiibacteriota bacterium]